MNSLCCGDYFPSLRKYRCLMDGMFHPMETLAAKCAACERPIAAKIHETVQIRSLIAVEVYIHPVGWVEVESHVTAEIGHTKIPAPALSAREAAKWSDTL